jgi:hypothetical protein
MADGPDRSTIEIKTLLHKLTPRANHKDRVRALTRFRNYVSGASSKKKVTTPEFYDDDLPLLFLGSESPVALYDDEQYGDLSAYHGLLQACSTPSTDHQGGLKRSARNAMNLVKYLACDHADLADGEPVPSGFDAKSGQQELSPFAYALCSMKPAQLKIANFDAHLKTTSYNSEDGNARSGAKSEACQVLVLLFSRHFDPLATDGNSSTPTLIMHDLLPSQAAKQAFENWMVQNVSKDVQNIVRSRATKSILVTDLLTPKGNNAANPFADDQIEVDIDVMGAFKKRDLTQVERKAIADAEAHANEQLDGLGIKLYKKDDALFESTGNEPPTTWRDSKLAKKQVQLSSADSESVRGGGVSGPDIIMKSKDEEKIKKRNEERQRMIGKDPLGIRPDNFDLNNVQGRALEMLTDAIHDLADEMDDFEPDEAAMESARRKKKKKDRYAYAVDQLISLGSQKNALEAIFSGDQDENKEGDIAMGETGETGETKASSAVGEFSILPTDAHFNAMLFLTLVHRDAGYEQLKNSIRRLDSKSQFVIVTSHLAYLINSVADWILTNLSLTSPKKIKVTIKCSASKNASVKILNFTLDAQTALICFQIKQERQRVATDQEFTGGLIYWTNLQILVQCRRRRVSSHCWITPMKSERFSLP